MDGIPLVKAKEKLNSPTLGSLFIVCHNLEGSLAFYKALGFQLKETKTRSFVLKAGLGVELHLHQRLTEEEKGLYGVEWAAGSHGMVQSYEVKELEPLLQAIPPQSVLREPVATPWGTRLMMVTDPDGHLLELRERKEER
jgi:catechol 2,3-dioxygenase-like lactoylglutathione lyase family enzyme